MKLALYKYAIIIFIIIDILSISPKLPSGECHKTSLMISQQLLVIIDAGIGLVPSGYKPYPELLLSQFYVAIWRQQVTIS